MSSKLPSSSATEFYNFMIDPPAEIYRNWLPEEHYEFHLVSHSDKSPVNDLLYFDQNIGNKYRLKFYAIIKEANNPNRIVFQMHKFGMNLPGYLELDFLDTAEGLLLTETLRIGLNGFGRVCDPIIKIFFGNRFFEVFRVHHKREWQNLSEILLSTKRI